MPTPVPRDATFPMALCARCEKSVLTYVGLADDGAELRMCVHCDGPVIDELQWVPPGELEQAGYYFGPPPAQGASSCNSGCGSCAVKKA